MTQVTFCELVSMTIEPVLKPVRRWYWVQVERHALMCADVERRKAAEAMAFEKNYHGRAAIAKSNYHRASF